MTTTSEPTSHKPLRLWPGVVAVLLLWLARFGLKAVIPGFAGFRLAMLFGFGGVFAVLMWWVFFSRARWSDRMGGILLMAVALAGTWQLRHESMGPVWLLGYALPVVCLALVAGATAARRLDGGRRRATMAATILIACGAWTLVRSDGITGDHVLQFRWRWAKSSEDRIKAEARSKAVDPAPVKALNSAQRAPTLAGAPAVTETPKPFATTALDRPALSERGIRRVEWPGFRGPERDGTSRGVRIETDWSASPPVELWRRPIGPGWSSFAVRGDRVYTQEQRGGDEVVACYDATTGMSVWTHHDAARFFESNAGPGPRGTPTLSDDRVYTLGATGILNALDAGNGAVAWSRNAAVDIGASLPVWGFSSSPLVVGDVVIVAVAGTLAAYDLATGKPRWTGPARGESYSSPQLMTIEGITQVVHLNGTGAAGFAPADGKLLWEHQWKGLPIVQPALTADGDILISASGESGIRRIAVAYGPGGWTVDRRWGSNGLKPYFNDFVVHEGHAFGFDGRILSCIDLADGTRKWKGGRYGNGQLVLLPDQGLLLVLSDEGELALVRAAADQFTELARFPAIEGKTWNHPVLMGDVLLVRNGQEMAAFRLSRSGR